MNIYQRLKEARARVHRLSFKKSGCNAFAGFGYYELSDFLPQTLEILSELELISLFTMNKDTAKLTIVNTASPEETVIFESPIAEMSVAKGNAVQSIGATHTYMRRYLYFNALELIENDTFDAQSDKRSTGTVDKTSTVEAVGIDYKASIACVTDVKGLNKIYRFMLDNAQDDTWKSLIKTKAEAINASWDKYNHQFCCG